MVTSPNKYGHDHVNSWSVLSPYPTPLYVNLMTDLESCHGCWSVATDRLAYRQVSSFNNLLAMFIVINAGFIGEFVFYLFLIKDLPKTCVCLFTIFY